MNRINIEDYKIIRGLPPLLSPSHRVAIDTEFSGMDRKRLHRPTGQFTCATFYFGTDEVYIVEDIRDLAQALYNVEQAGWVFHNAAFDIFHLRRYTVVPRRNKIWDTQLVEQVRFSGRYDEYNLAACCRRNLDLFLDKEERETFTEHEGEMTQSQIEYSCIDPIATHMLFWAQKSQMDADDLRVWKEVEMPYMWVVIGKSGMPLDVEEWTRLAVLNRQRADEAQAKYGTLVQKISTKTGKPLKGQAWEGLNLGSNPQVLAKLKSLGFNIESTGKKILEALENSVDEVSMEGEDTEFVKDLTAYRKYAKRASTYGQDFLDKHLEPDNKIYPGIFQREAGTSRSSSRNPNGQNIPSRDTKEFRKCFIAGEGYKLIIADYSSQEPRLAAEFSQDEKLISIFRSGKDVYIESAREVFNEIIDKSSPRRKNMKDLTLATIYGKGRNKLAEDMKVDPDTAQHMLDAFYATFPSIKSNYIIPFQRFVKEHEYVTTVNGAKLWVNTYESGGKPMRTAVNYPIQGSAAEMLKMATSCFVSTWDGENFYDNISFLLPVHDEILLRVPENRAAEARDLLVKCMIDVAQVFHPSVPAAVEAFVADNWAEKG